MASKDYYMAMTAASRFGDSLNKTYNETVDKAMNRQLAMEQAKAWRQSHQQSVRASNLSYDINKETLRANRLENDMNEELYNQYKNQPPQNNTPTISNDGTRLYLPSPNGLNQANASTSRTAKKLGSYTPPSGIDLFQALSDARAAGVKPETVTGITGQESPPPSVGLETDTRKVTINGAPISSVAELPKTGQTLDLMLKNLSPEEIVNGGHLNQVIGKAIEEVTIGAKYDGLDINNQDLINDVIGSQILPILQKQLQEKGIAVRSSHLQQLVEEQYGKQKSQVILDSNVSKMLITDSARSKTTGFFNSLVNPFGNDFSGRDIRNVESDVEKMISHGEMTRAEAVFGLAELARDYNTIKPRSFFGSVEMDIPEMNNAITRTITRGTPYENITTRDDYDRAMFEAAEDPEVFGDFIADTAILNPKDGKMYYMFAGRLLPLDSTTQEEDQEYMQRAAELVTSIGVEEGLAASPLDMDYYGDTPMTNVGADPNPNADRLNFLDRMSSFNGINPTPVLTEPVKAPAERYEYEDRMSYPAWPAVVPDANGWDFLDSLNTPGKQKSLPFLNEPIREENGYQPNL